MLYTNGKPHSMLASICESDAVCDASHFVDAMQIVVAGASSLKDATTTYSQEVVRRGSDEVLISKQNAIMMLDWDQLMESPMMKRSLQKSDLQ